MQNHFRTMRARRAESDRGFTLIELLVVVVIIGILVAIAIPVYLNYRQGAADKSAQSDVRGAIAAVEQFYTSNSNAYPATGTINGNDLVLDSPGATPQRATISDGTDLEYENNGTSYVLCALNEGGEQVYVYNSSASGAVQESAAASVDACIAAES